MITFRIDFHGGSYLEGNSSDPTELAKLAGVVRAKGLGRDDMTIGLEGERVRTVGEIRAIDIKGEWS